MRSETSASSMFEHVEDILITASLVDFWPIPDLSVQSDQINLPGKSVM